jgi:hypothetical protein
LAPILLPYSGLINTGFKRLVRTVSVPEMQQRIMWYWGLTMTVVYRCTNKSLLRAQAHF